MLLQRTTINESLLAQYYWGFLNEYHYLAAPSIRLEWRPASAKVGHLMQTSLFGKWNENSSIFEVFRSMIHANYHQSLYGMLLSHRVRLHRIWRCSFWSFQILSIESTLFNRTLLSNNPRRMPVFGKNNSGGIVDTFQWEATVELSNPLCNPITPWSIEFTQLQVTILSDSEAAC